MPYALQLQNLTRTFRTGDAPALRQANLEVEEGEILAMVGESGSGKTTLLRCICGLEKPDEGSVTVHGRLVASDTTWVPPEKRQVGLVFQDGALFPHLTVEKNIGYGLQDLDRVSIRNRVDSLLAMVGMDGYQKRFPHELSGGERQRLAVVRALAPEPAVVLFDEPFSNLDPMLRCGIRDQILRILKELRTTAILVTHDTDDALHAGDRIAVLHQGSIEQIGTPREVYHHPVNGYCARLFGAANSVGGSWVRPEDMRLLPAFEPGSHPVMIEKAVDAGKHRELHVRPEGMGPGERWTLYESEVDWIQPGTPAWVQLLSKPE